MNSKVAPPHKHACPHCSSEYHQWDRVHIDNGVQLVELENQFICWCNKKEEFVLSEKIKRD